jgi:AP endonuclease-1
MKNAEMSDSPLSEAPSAFSEAEKDVQPAVNEVIPTKGNGKRSSTTHLEPSTKKAKRAKTSNGPVYKEEDKSDEEEDVKAVEATPKKNRTHKGTNKKTTVVQAEVEVEEEQDPIADKSPKKAIKKRITIKKSSEQTEGTQEVDKDAVAKKKVVRKRKTKEEKEAEAMPLAARTLGSKIVLGAHISSAGGKYSS